MLMNDSWVLGGLHGNHEFHLAYDGDDKAFKARSIVNSANSEYPLFVTGRELIGITYFGYSLAEGHDTSVFGRVFVCTQPVVANAATFQEYWRQVAGVEAALRG